LETESKGKTYKFTYAKVEKEAEGRKIGK